MLYPRVQLPGASGGVHLKRQAGPARRTDHSFGSLGSVLFRGQKGGTSGTNMARCGSPRLHFCQISVHTKYHAHHRWWTGHVSVEPALARRGGTSTCICSARPRDAWPMSASQPIRSARRPDEAWVGGTAMKTIYVVQISLYSTYNILTVTKRGKTGRREKPQLTIKRLPTLIHSSRFPTKVHSISHSILHILKFMAHIARVNSESMILFLSYDASK